jgi:hypothetical protein
VPPDDHKFGFGGLEIGHRRQANLTRTQRGSRRHLR